MCLKTCGDRLSLSDKIDRNPFPSSSTFPQGRIFSPKPLHGGLARSPER
ncbi:hypothetical protein [[Limnothrix rosea] IAM M-220]|nr:hypothetical protein [[Limnothrix rosea] IAM M-220]